MMPSTAMSRGSPNIYIDGTTYAAPPVDVSVEFTSAIWPFSKKGTLASQSAILFSWASINLSLR